ncbi:MULTISPECIES: transketolase C-terminal domain-containing protein [unclassified Mesorhizobium]|uniref:alpha-ketoacid dehydrogenase subunit beta n=1 Tax=unclassified Mesorhizobium TaxID=325217 RepID=UPI00112D6042|nr:MULTISPECIES: transketolase C-terminal domain-containing protein [unclassified Mesorhizobium]TPI18320.1 alpha-ketoacid dehydrogenase subunit beta [Mesorhizobium sp. B4-1-1]TPL46480.1 alpha-ketoacid dehydrogenase subunit beta [Mesorhizobium sp. B2-4-6]
MTASIRKINASQAVAESLMQEMARDESVVLLGEDVGRSGGVFGSSRDLLERFGPMRVRDTPISEMSFTGMGVGMAMAGLRPVVEIMFVDFMGVCLEQIYNAMAKIPYMSGGRVKMPMVIKTAGGNIGSAAQHSQCLWGTFAHLPGMHVVAPASVRDHKGLMAAAIRSDNPVVFIEHKGLLLKKAKDFLTGSEVPEDAFVTPIGKAEVARKGGDITLVTLSAGVEYAMEAAAEVAADGIDAEVIDLRSIVPLDTETVAASAARTGRLLVVDEDYLSFGLSAEVVVRVLEKLGPTALRQIRRHAVPDVPIPAALSLEEALVPGPASIARVLREMAAVS